MGYVAFALASSDCRTSRARVGVQEVTWLAVDTVSKAEELRKGPGQLET